MILFNVRGLLMAIAASVLAVGVGYLASIVPDERLGVVSGPICIAIDLTWRVKSLRRYLVFEHYLVSREVGGTMLFMPVWILGIVQLGMGIFFTIVRGGGEGGQ